MNAVKLPKGQKSVPYAGQIWYGGICSLGEQFIKRLMVITHDCTEEYNNYYHAIEMKGEIFVNLSNGLRWLVSDGIGSSSFFFFFFVVGVMVFYQLFKIKNS